MKYKSNDSVQNCIPGGVEQQIQQIAPPVDMKVDEVPKLFISLSCENHKKNVTTKTCTCSGGMVPCPIHEGTNRSSINGYTQNTTSTMNLKATSNTSKDEMTKKHLPLQRCKENGKILNKTKHDDDVLVEANDFEGNALLSSRTIIIESSKCSHLSNNKNCDSSNEQHPSANFNLDELKLSLTSLVSNDTTITDTEKQATESYQNWLSKKKRQEREIRQRESHLKKLIEQEKQKKIQMEQENFLNWLHCKKEKEKQEKEIRKKALMEEQRRNKEKLKREEINKKQYQLWLKLKKEQDLSMNALFSIIT